MTILNRTLGFAAESLPPLTNSMLRLNPASCLMCHEHADIIGIFVANEEMSRLMSRMKTPESTGFAAYGLCTSCEKTFDLADVEYRLFTNLDLPAATRTDLLKRLDKNKRASHVGGTNGN